MALRGKQTYKRQERGQNTRVRDKGSGRARRARLGCWRSRFSAVKNFRGCPNGEAGQATRSD